MPPALNRRMFISALAGAASVSAAPPKGSIIELRQYQLRNSADNQAARIADFIEKHAVPAAKRNGSNVAGVFANLVAPNGPFVLMVNSYPSLAAMEAEQGKLADDKEFTSALDAYYRAGLAYQRVDVTLLRAFEGMPKIEFPPAGKAPRVFELRTYESDSPASLRRKIKMFEDGEAAIFRRLGMKTIFFGAAFAGSNIPSLTYMLAYDDLAHREATWKAFGADPEWGKLRATPGLSDAELVSNISSILLRPLPFSSLK